MIEEKCLQYKVAFVELSKSTSKAAISIMDVSTLLKDVDNNTVVNFTKRNNSEFDSYIKSYRRWGISQTEKEKWIYDLQNLIKENCKINNCPRCGEKAEIFVSDNLYPDGVSIDLVIRCPECRKIEVHGCINDFYGNDTTAEMLVDRFNNLKVKF